MGYQKALSDEQQAIVEPIMERLSSLEEGKGLVIRERPENLPRLRRLLYTHWNNEGIKSQFRIFLWEEDAIRVVRQQVLAPVIEADEPSPVETFVLENLLEVTDHGKVERSLVERFTFPEVEEGLNFWEKITEWKPLEDEGKETP